MSSGSRHKACNQCREKKIRCDGQHPCQRCRGSGDSCDFTTQSRPSKLDFTQALETFNERLSQAENALAAQRNASNPFLPSGAFETDSMALWPQPLGILQSSPEQQMASLLNNGQPAAPSMTVPPGIDFGDPAIYPLPPIAPFQQPNEPLPSTNEAPAAFSAAAIPPLGDNTGTHGRRDHLTARSQNSGLTRQDWSDSHISSNISTRITTPGTSIAQSDALDSLPPTVGADLFQTYSQTIHCCFPMIDGQRFQSCIDDTPRRSELVALRNVIWAHAAVFSPQYSYLSDKFYLQARMQIEITEAEDPRRFFTIPALQTLILLALYELKQTCFTRSWVSVSRATWLAHSLGLYRMDRNNAESGDSCLLDILPFTDDPMALEERRRTFWAMLQINCFSTISAYLPTDDLDEQNPGKRVTLGRALTSPMTGVLCSLQGSAIAASLCIRCVSHVAQVNKEYSVEPPIYDFWTHHHHLNGLINHATYTALAHLKPTEYTTDLNALSLQMILQATTICLHQAVISRVCKVERYQAYTSIVQESEQRCIEVVLEFVGNARYLGHVNAAKYLVRKVQANPSSNPPSRNGLSSGTPKSSPMTSPTGPYHSRKPSMNTSDRFGAFHPGPKRSSTNSGQTTPNGNSSCVTGPDNARLLDSRHFLRSRLSALKATIPLAKVFEAQIDEEIEGGEAATRDRLVGLARFLPPAGLGTDGSGKMNGYDDTGNIPVATSS
ncbi:MAG: hypothetical protein Q9219_004839 [cf. Caloplaca sp. 3 TL-2023]